MNDTRTHYAGGQEHENEPVPGLPASLPAGERILWQGSPRFAAMATQAFHVRKVAVYFALLIGVRGALALADGMSPVAALGHALWLLPLAAGGIGLLMLLAWLVGRSTLYTITTKRVVLRYGVALPMSINVPFAIIESAGLRVRDDGTGELTLALGGADRIAYLHLWPHARPWALKQPQPMLRGIEQPQAVAALLAAALAGEPLPQWAEANPAARPGSAGGAGTLVPAGF